MFYNKSIFVYSSTVDFSVWLLKILKTYNFLAEQVCYTKAVYTKAGLSLLYTKRGWQEENFISQLIFLLEQST